MKINLTKRQYTTIIRALEVSSFVYDPLSDFIDDKYNRHAKEIDEVQSALLLHAREFDFEDNVEYFESGVVTNESYMDEILEDIHEYDEYKLYDNLANKLGWRDFLVDHSEVELKKIQEEHGDYWGVPVYDYEKRYYDEFEKHGYERLYIKES